MDSTIIEALEQRIESVPLGQTVDFYEIVGVYNEPQYIEAAKMLLAKYGIEYTQGGKEKGHD